MLGDGVANGFTDVAIENVDIGRPCSPGAIGGAKSPACDPLAFPPNMPIDITVLRGATGIAGGIIPYMLPVCWYAIGPGIGICPP